MLLNFKLMQIQVTGLYLNLAIVVNDLYPRPGVRACLKNLGVRELWHAGFREHLRLNTPLWRRGGTRLRHIPSFSAWARVRRVGAV